MYKIKQQPEDFFVREISNAPLENTGKYSVFLLKKRNLSTPECIKIISRRLGIKDREIGYAGNKDKTAVAEQFISIRNCRIKKLDEKKSFTRDHHHSFGPCVFMDENADFSIDLAGYSETPISLGDLVGNYFEIVVQDFSIAELKNFERKAKKKIMIPNYFGEQRFGKNNSDIGRAIVKRDFKKAAALLEENTDLSAAIREHLQEKKSDFVGALLLVPRRILMLYVHAYQAMLWNDAVKMFLLKNKMPENFSAPLIGFGTDINAIKNPEMKKLFEDILKNEKISTRDFIFHEIPFLSQEGNWRELFFEISDLKVLENEKDKIKVSFTLPKGCYATVAIDELFSK